MQSLFQQNLSLTLRLLLIIPLCITLMTTDHRYETLQGFRSAMSSYLVYPLQIIVSTPTRVLDWAGSSLSNRSALLAENTRLKADNLKLQAAQQKFLGIEKENERLRELLQSSDRVAEEVLIAEVVTVDQDAYIEQIVINKGLEHNVYQGQPIIDSTGVMGQIININQHSAIALLISDPSHAIPVQSNRNNIRTIAQGKGNPHELDLLYIPNNTDLKVGDLMISSGLGGRFPANYPVAVISEVTLQPGQQFAQVRAVPTALLDKSREVLLVWTGSNAAALKQVAK